uniref:Uncharacterized protein n=1 Tax=Siphoviridae sp. ctWhx86 TaxID=2826362 RepID=A0A8S5QPB2_9CAUD|nr:MAG TPA: hypothetical protein [Siphoviridae sp. ctWhx86]
MPWGYYTPRHFFFLYFKRERWNLLIWRIKNILSRWTLQLIPVALSRR